MDRTNAGQAVRASLPPGRPGRAVIPVFVAVWSALVLVPLLILVAYSFFETQYFVMIYTPSLRTWSDVFSSGRFDVTLRTLRIAVSVTAIALLIGFPFALWLAKGDSSRSTRAILLALLTIPFFLDHSSRVIVWRGLLAENGTVNTALLDLGVISRPLTGLLFTEGSVQFGMLLSNFALMVLPIYMSLSVIDDDLLAAAADLGASPARILRDVIIPLSLPGVVAGIVLMLGASLAAWVEPAMLGGGFVNLLSASVESAYTALRYPVVAALSTLAIVLIAGLLAIFLLVTRRFVDVGGSFRSLES